MSEIVICGDFNINYNLSHTDSFQLLKDLEREIINKDTRITSTRIDLIFTNCSNITDSGTIDFCMSDHEIVYFVKKKTRSKAHYNDCTHFSKLCKR